MRTARRLPCRSTEGLRNGVLLRFGRVDGPQDSAATRDFFPRRTCISPTTPGSQLETWESKQASHVQPHPFFHLRAGDGRE